VDTAGSYQLFLVITEKSDSSCDHIKNLSTLHSTSSFTKCQKKIVEEGVNVEL